MLYDGNIILLKTTVSFKELNELMLRVSNKAQYEDRILPSIGVEERTVYKNTPPVKEIKLFVAPVGHDKRIFLEIIQHKESDQHRVESPLEPQKTLLKAKSTEVIFQNALAETGLSVSCSSLSTLQLQKIFDYMTLLKKQGELGEVKIIFPRLNDIIISLDADNRMNIEPLFIRA